MVFINHLSIRIIFLDKNDERSFKRELELFENDIQDEWELDDNEYLSKEEQQDAYEREKKTLTNDVKDNPNEDDKRWLDVDTMGNGMCTDLLLLFVKQECVKQIGFKKIGTQGVHKDLR